MIKRLLQQKLMCFSIVLFSHSVLADSQIEDEKKLLADIFPTTCHFSGQFLQQKRIEGLPVPLRSDGDFFFSCDLGLIWSTQSPFKDALLYVNASRNYRINERGEIEPLSGIAHYSMSKIFLRLLRGDTDYFANEFAVSEVPETGVIELRPESGFMQKGIERIDFKKNQSLEHGVSLQVNVVDATGQVTQVSIDKITEHEIEGKRNAFEQCEKLYPSTSKWCEVLRSPARFDK